MPCFTRSLENVSFSVIYIEIYTNQFVHEKKHSRRGMKMKKKNERVVTSETKMKSEAKRMGKNNNNGKQLSEEKSL